MSEEILGKLQKQQNTAMRLQEANEQEFYAGQT